MRGSPLLSSAGEGLTVPLGVMVPAALVVGSNDVGVSLSSSTHQEAFELFLKRREPERAGELHVEGSNWRHRRMTASRSRVGAKFSERHGSAAPHPA
jgi:hypothetical protein